MCKCTVKMIKMYDVMLFGCFGSNLELTWVSQFCSFAKCSETYDRSVAVGDFVGNAGVFLKGGRLVSVSNPFQKSTPDFQTLPCAGTTFNKLFFPSLSIVGSWG